MGLLGISDQKSAKTSPRKVLIMMINDKCSEWGMIIILAMLWSCFPSLDLTWEDKQGFTLSRGHQLEQFFCVTLVHLSLEQIWKLNELARSPSWIRYENGDRLKAAPLNLLKLQSVSNPTPTFPCCALNRGLKQIPQLWEEICQPLKRSPVKV